MDKQTRVRINVLKIKPGMELAEDVYTPKGLMLIPKKTIIDDKHIFRIKLYQIVSLYIYVNSDSPLDEDISEVLQSSFKQTISQNFTDFKESYHIYHELTTKKLNEIFDGGPVVENDLFEITTSIVDSLRTKTELFNYMYHLRNEDDYTYTHCLNVSILANIFANWLELPEKQIKEVTITGLLHDIGKIKIDKKILNKPGSLTNDEFKTIRKHSTYGYDTLKVQTINKEIKDGVLFHHEKLDGSGYPLGLKGEQIPLYAKIISIVDIYDAMTSKRTYHEKHSPFKVIRMFEQESYGLLDTKLLFVFLENIAHNYLGKDVELSTGDKARVVFIHNQSPSRPIVQVDDKMINLMFEPNISIESIL